MKIGDVVGGRYEVVRRAATTEAGVVYLGHDRERDDDVAIKVLTSASRTELDRFRLEAGILRSLLHPNIARFLEFGTTTDGQHYLVQAWVGGISLRQHLDRIGMTAVQAVGMARQVASALAAAHDNGIIHRDIKPGNILASEASWIVIDFGVARVVGEVARLTHTGTVIGTAGYIAPEQGRTAEIDPRADVFSLGCVVYEALTGCSPFAGENALAIQAKIVAAEPAPLASLAAELPQALCELVMRCLAKDPAARPSSGDVARALCEVEEAGVPVTEPRPVRRAEPPTAAGPSASPVSVVLAAPNPDIEGPMLAAWHQRVCNVLGPFGGTPAIFVDGSVVFVAPRGSDGESSVDVAAGAALALHREHPDIPLAVASATDLGQLDSPLEAAGAAIERASLARLFADHQSAAPAPGIRIDALTAGHLGREFIVADGGDVCMLLGKRAHTRG